MNNNRCPIGTLPAGRADTLAALGMQPHGHLAIGCSGPGQWRDAEAFPISLPRNTDGERQGEVRVGVVKSCEWWGEGKPIIIQESVEASSSWGGGWSHCFLLTLQVGRNNSFKETLSAPRLPASSPPDAPAAHH